MTNEVRNPEDEDEQEEVQEDEEEEDDASKEPEAVPSDGSGSEGKEQPGNPQESR